jgi:RNA polymerase sigma-70 factor (ECF subfamily)
VVRKKMRARPNLSRTSRTFGVMNTYDNLARVEPEPSTEQLRSRARFDDTYRSNRDFVMGVVRRMGIPPGDAEDVVQDVFVVLHARLPELHARASLRPWLRTVAVHVCNNRKRSLLLRRRRQLSGEQHVDPDALYDRAQRAPDESAAHGEERTALVSALAQLDPQKRQVLVLTALEDRTAAEIAGLICTSPNTVSSRLRAARQRVAEALSAPTPPCGPTGRGRALAMPHPARQQRPRSEKSA